MSCWEVLQISPTKDVKAIKKAYMTLLKTCNPEDKPDEFMALRAAYEEALRQAKEGLEDTEAPEDKVEDTSTQAEKLASPDYRQLWYEEQLAKEKRYQELVASLSFESDYQLSVDITDPESLINALRLLYEHPTGRWRLHNWKEILDHQIFFDLSQYETLIATVINFICDYDVHSNELIDFFMQRFDHPSFYENFPSHARLIQRKLHQLHNRKYFGIATHALRCMQLNREELLKNLEIRYRIESNAHPLHSGEASLNQYYNEQKQLFLEALGLFQEDSDLLTAILRPIPFKVISQWGEALEQFYTSTLNNEFFLLSANVDIAEIHCWLGYYHYYHLNRSKAFDCFIKALELADDFPDALKGLALCYVGMARYEEASVLLEELFNGDLADLEALHLCNEVQQRHLKKLQSSGREPLVQYKLLFSLKRYNECISMYEAEKLERNEETEFIYGVSLMYASRSNEGMEHIKKSFDFILGQGSNIYFYARELLLNHKFHFDDEIRDMYIDYCTSLFDKTIEGDADHYLAAAISLEELALFRGEGSLVDKRISRIAFEYIDKASKIRPEDKNIHLRRGTIAYFARYDKEAISSFEKIRRSYRSRADVHGYLGICYYNLGDYKTAISCIENALEWCQENAERRQFYVDYLKRVNEAAAKQSSTAINIDSNNKTPRH